MTTDVTIYHNPTCGTSRKVLGLLRDAGVQPRVIEYLKTPPTQDEMRALLKQLGMTPRDILRRKGSLFGELGLGDPAKSDEILLDALQSHPVLMERPIVATARGTRVCRPAERVNDLLP